MCSYNNFKERRRTRSSRRKEDEERRGEERGGEFEHDDMKERKIKPCPGLTDRWAQLQPIHAQRWPASGSARARAGRAHAGTTCTRTPRCSRRGPPPQPLRLTLLASASVLDLYVSLLIARRRAGRGPAMAHPQQPAEVFYASADEARPAGTATAALAGAAAAAAAAAAGRSVLVAAVMDSGELQLNRRALADRPGVFYREIVADVRRRRGREGEEEEEEEEEEGEEREQRSAKNKGEGDAAVADDDKDKRI